MTVTGRKPMTGSRRHLIGTLLIRHRDEIPAGLAERVREGLRGNYSNDWAEKIIAALSGKPEVTGM
jgi:hypothetical protein